MRIFVVAGPRACGKTTFIERCRTDAHGFLPSDLRGIAEAHGPIYFMDLGGFEHSGSADLLVHVDLVTPFVGLLPRSDAELLEGLRAAAFADYPGASIFRECARLDVLTLRVSRALTLRRWLGRCAAQGRASVPTMIARLYSDARGDAAYSALFAAWDRYVAELPNAHAWDVIETAEAGDYSVVRR